MTDTLTELDRLTYANEEAERELFALRADARRYRWLRDNLQNTSMEQLPPMVYIGYGSAYNEPLPSTLDVAIDTAMLKEKPDQAEEAREFADYGERNGNV